MGPRRVLVKVNSPFYFSLTSFLVSYKISFHAIGHFQLKYQLVQLKKDPAAVGSHFKVQGRGLDR